MCCRPSGARRHAAIRAFSTLPLSLDGKARALIRLGRPGALLHPFDCTPPTRWILLCLPARLQLNGAIAQTRLCRDSARAPDCIAPVSLYHGAGSNPKFPTQVSFHGLEPVQMTTPRQASLAKHLGNPDYTPKMVWPCRLPQESGVHGIPLAAF